jgi:DNA-binding response OmpR family regulator
MHKIEADRRALVLVVEDDERIEKMLTVLLERENFRVAIAHDGAEAIECLRRGSYDAVVLDLLLPKMNGFEVLRHVKATQPALLRRTVVLTAASEATLRNFDSESTLIRKPFDIFELLAKLEACCPDRDLTH